MIENHAHISSLRVYLYHAPNGAPENTEAVATHITPLTGLRKTPAGRCYPHFAPNGALENTGDVATHSTPLTGLRKTHAGRCYP
jgi:hypothetical protein